MRIRCERCATIYELDEKRLPAHGALVKCTRCDHVFRAAPPAPGSPVPPADGPGPDGQRAPAEERTALFGFSTPAASVEQTASLASAPGPVPARQGAHAGHAPRSVRPVAPANRPGPRWQWVVVAVLLAALALALGWYVLQSRAATPTTRLPAGAEVLPT